MKKYRKTLAMLMMLTLLNGCASHVQPIETEPSATAATVPAKRSPAEESELSSTEETIPVREETNDASNVVASQPTEQKQKMIPADTKPTDTEPPESKPESTEPTHTEPPMTEPPEVVQLDTLAIEAYGRAYASSLGFVIDTSLGKGNSGYYSPDYWPLCSGEEGCAVTAGMVTATKNQLNSRFSTESCEVLVEEAYGIARCNVKVEYSHKDEVGDWYYTYVFYG